MNTPCTDGGADAEPTSRKTLDALLDAMIDHPERRKELTGEIEQRFGKEQATLILDMTGFTRTTRTHGIVQFLLMIHQMHRMCCPSIGEHGGTLIKTEADNLFCLFPDVKSALEAAHDIIGRLQTANLVLPEDRHLYASIGIGYGYILNIAGEDLYGDEVNLACKLSEDIGERNAILFTERAREQLGDAGAETEAREVSISGISLVFHELRHVPKNGTA